MLKSAFALLCAAVLIGAGLAVAYLRGPQAKPPHRIIALMHGLIGAAGLAVLLVTLRRGLPHTGMGTSGFGVISAALLGTAFVLGVALAVSWRSRRPPSAFIGFHASLAIAGFVMLLTVLALAPGRSAAAKARLLRRSGPDITNRQSLPQRSVALPNKIEYKIRP
jgi:hypothetical protein